MSKISKKLFDDYKATKKVVKKAKYAHSLNTDKIIEIIRPYVDSRYVKNNSHRHITGFDFCYDNDYKIKDLPVEQEWIEITGKEYYNIYHSKDTFFTKPEIKVEDTADYDEIYYKKDKKRYNYLRVYVHESWAYGGNDDVSFDFLLTDIMNNTYLRKEKLKKLEELS